MSEIPADVMDAAYDAAERVSSTFEKRRYDAMLPAVSIIARAILAERKRCAGVADEHARNAERRDGEYWGAASEAEAIAQAILTPSKEPQT